MSAQVHSAPGQNEGRKKVSLTCGGNVNYKSVHQLIPTRENREHPSNFQNKSVSSAFS